MKYRPESVRGAFATLIAGCVVSATGCAQDVILGEQIALPPTSAVTSTSVDSDTSGSGESRASQDAGLDSSNGRPPWDDRSNTDTDTMWPHPHPGEEFPPGPDRPRPGETSAEHRTDESNPDFMFPPRTDQMLPDFSFELPTGPGPDFSGNQRSDSRGSSEF